MSLYYQDFPTPPQPLFLPATPTFHLHAQMFMHTYLLLKGILELKE